MRRNVYGPYLGQMDATKLAVISLTQCLNQLLMASPVSFVTLAGYAEVWMDDWMDGRGGYCYFWRVIGGYAQ